MSALLWPVLVSAFTSLSSLIGLVILVGLVVTGFSIAGAGFCIAGAVIDRLVGTSFNLAGAVIDRLVGTSFNLVSYITYKTFEKNHHHHINNKGYTLIEILIALGILSITSGIAYVSYQGYTSSVSKKDLYTHGKLFVMSVKNCITIRGGWEIERLTNDGIPDENLPKYYPCDTGQNTPTNSGKTATDLLKSKLDFTCPTNAECNTFTNGVSEHDHIKLKYTCLNIKKKVSGKKLQIISRISWKDTTKTEIWCNEVDEYLVFNRMHCRRGAELHMKHPPQVTNPPPPVTSELKKGCPDWK